MSEEPPGENGRQDRLADLERRIAAARDAAKPKPAARRNEYAAAAYAWQMVIELVMAIVIGGAMGWGLDLLFGTMPLFLIVFVMLGFASGVRLMLRTARDMNRERPGQADRDE